jgi:hypothetical protein
VRAYKKLIWIVALATMIACVGWPARADAQGRRGRVSGGHRGGTRVVVVGGGYYGGYYANPFWFGSVYDPWYGFGYQYPYGPYPYPYRYSYDPGGEIRLEVTPKQAEAYVDGYYAGIVDDFDGVFQRLPVEPGEHEIALYLDGYREVRQKIYVTPRNTFKLKYAMEKLGPGEQPEPRPEPVNPPQPQGPGQPQGVGQPPGPAQRPMPPQGPPPGRGPAGRRMPPPQQPPQDPQRGVEVSAYGTIAIRVQPTDVDVLIDGEKWRGPESHDRLLVEVSEGRHTVEIQKTGYRTYVTEVEVRRGDTTALNVSLRTPDQQ